MAAGPRRQLWDLVVLGGGTAGIVAARTAAGLGASVALVERDRTGGDCLWTGCVPSKALLAAAAGRLGESSMQGDDNRRFTMAMAHVRESIVAIEPDDSPQMLSRAGVRVVHGQGRLTPGADVIVDDAEVLHARQLLLATGSSPTVPNIDGLRNADPFTSDSIWSLTALPSRLTVLGGGAVGCELAQAFARLGSAVTIVELASRLLPGEDPDASVVVHGALTRDGVRVLTSTGVFAAAGRGPAGSVTTDSGVTIQHDAVLVATGRRPRTTGIGLDDAGVEVDADGYLVIDKYLRTTNRRVWAAGDLTGHPQFTHVAGVHASTAASNAVLGLRRRPETAVVPRVTYTDPEVAAAGVPTPAGHGDLTTLTRSHSEVDRAVVEGDTAGFSRLVVDRRGRLVGTTLVGPRAGESLAELVLAMKHGLRTRDLARAMHAYPTFADGPWNAAIADVQDGLSLGLPARVVHGLGRVHRRWLDVTDTMRSQHSSR